MIPEGRIEFRILPQDLAYAVRRDCGGCLVARALQRTLALGYEYDVRVYRGDCAIFPAGSRQEVAGALFDESLREVVRAFDHGQITREEHLEPDRVYAVEFRKVEPEKEES